MQTQPETTAEALSLLEPRSVKERLADLGFAVRPSGARGAFAGMHREVVDLATGEIVLCGTARDATVQILHPAVVREALARGLA